MSGFSHLGDEELWTGYVYRLVTGSYSTPDGSQFERFVFRSPGAVSVVPVLDDPPPDDADAARVVLISQYRPAHDELVVEIPAGVRDVDGEADEENVRRELGEEVGLRPGRIELLTSIYPSAGMTDSVNTIFLATGCTPTERHPDGPEEQYAEVFEIPLAEALEWVEAGRIVDAKSVVGLLLADRRLRRGR